MRPPKKALRGSKGLMTGGVMTKPCENPLSFAAPNHIPSGSRHGIPGLEDSEDVLWWFVGYHPVPGPHGSNGLMTRVPNEYVQEKEKSQKMSHYVQECSLVAWRASEGIQNAVIPL